ncbi:MAG: hypothetical protein FWF08_05500, partial [Oscillospiraceae bacterium]|nr:hypothetical protein [Oscillospiraceae bacterium]
DTCVYGGKVTVKKAEGANINVDKVTPFELIVKPVAQDLLSGINNWENDPAKRDYEIREFNKGVKIDDENYRLKQFLPRSGKDKLSELDPAGVAEAKYTPNADGTAEIVIKLKQEDLHDLSVPKYHSQATDFLEISNDDLDPFVFNGGTLRYVGATITAKVNKDGYLTKYDADIPAKVIDGKFAVTIAGKNYDALTGQLSGFWKTDLQFIYS